MPFILFTALFAMAAAAPCVEGDAAQCEARCTAGDAESCYRLARMHSQGNGIPVDEARAEQLFKRACDAGNGNGCNGLAFHFLEEDGERPWRDPAQAAALFDKGCRLGSAKACTNGGWQVQYERGVKLDGDKARWLYQRGCDELGSNLACYNLGLMYEDGRGVERSLDRASRGGGAWGPRPLPHAEAALRARPAGMHGG